MVSVTPGFVLAASLFYYFDYQGMFACTALSVAVHEAGHWLCLRLAGARVLSLRLELTGAVMYYETGRLSYAQELMAALAGPAAGLVFAGVSAAFAAKYLPLYTLAGVSAALSVFNLLPARGLDGGRAAYIALAYFFGDEAAQRVSEALNAAVAVSLTVSGVIMMIYAHTGAAAILFGVYFLSGSRFAGAIFKRTCKS